MLDNVLVTKDNVDKYVPTDANQAYATLPDPKFVPLAK